MGPKAGALSRYRPRVLTLIVLIIVGTAIALANLSLESATIDFLKKTYLVIDRAEHPFGWPLTWYWRIGGNAPGAPQWPVSRLSAPCLIGNVAMWLAMLAGTAAAWHWPLGRYWPRFRGRPRVSTLIPLMVVAVPTVLANLSCDVLPNSWQGEYYGWPLIWNCHIPAAGVFYMSVERWHYSAVGLAGNLLVWFLILAVTGLTWEGLVRRYRPRLRWSLKTMLAAVGLAAVVCASLARARSRAEKQDALIDLLGGEKSFVYRERNFYYVERWGPKWLDVVGANRFRRSIVGAHVGAADREIEEQFKRLAQLPDIRFLDMASSFSNDSSGCPQLGRFSPAMGEALGSMRQLRMLNVECERMYGHLSTDDFHECIAAVGNLTQLVGLGMHMWEENIDDLACLDKLTKLKRLKLSVISFANREDAEEAEAEGPEAGGDEDEKRDEPRTLARLPPLPRLEALTLYEWELGDRDLERLAGFPRLTSLDLSWTSVGAAGLVKLAPLVSLEELAINEDVATAAGFEALTTLKCLKAVHVAGPADNQTDDIKVEKLERRADLAGASYDKTLLPVTLAFDDGRELVVLPGELDGISRALAALRQSHPGLVIDAAYEEFQKRGHVEPPWHGKDREHAMRAYARQ